MKKAYASFLLCFLLLTGCTISDNEQLGLDDVQNSYGGKVSFKIGTFTSTNPNAAQGKLLEIDLINAELTRFGRNLNLPASNAAMLMYQRMTADERENYNGLQVVLQKGDSSFTFSYPMPMMADAAKSYHQLKILLDGYRQQNYQLVADRWNTVALNQPDRTNLAAATTRQGTKIGPIASFAPEGFSIIRPEASGHSGPLMNVLVSIAAPDGGTKQMQFCLNPNLPDNGQFLYGLAFLKPPFEIQ